MNGKKLVRADADTCLPSPTIGGMRSACSPSSDFRREKIFIAHCREFAFPVYTDEAYNFATVLLSLQKNRDTNVVSKILIKGSWGVLKLRKFNSTDIFFIRPDPITWRTLKISFLFAVWQRHSALEFYFPALKVCYLSIKETIPFPAASIWNI